MGSMAVPPRRPVRRLHRALDHPLRPASDLGGGEFALTLGPQGTLAAFAVGNCLPAEKSLLLWVTCYESDANDF